MVSHTSRLRPQPPTCSPTPFALQLARDGHLVTADRATDATAPAVLDAFLMQLADA